MKKVTPVPFLFGLSTLLWAGCEAPSPAPNASRDRAQEAEAVEARLMAEPTANDELVRRLNARVTKTGPLFIVRRFPLVPAHLERFMERVVSDSFDVFVVPSNTQWAVKMQ